MTAQPPPSPIITGAASGIGAATAVALARAGYRVGIGSYSGDPHDPGKTLAAVQEAGGEAVVHRSGRARHRVGRRRSSSGA